MAQVHVVYIFVREIMSSRHRFGIQVDRSVTGQSLERKVDKRIEMTELKY